MRVAMGTGVRDLQGISTGFKHGHFFPNQTTANGFSLIELPATTISDQNGFIDLEISPFVRDPSDSISDLSAPSTLETVISEGFSFDHVFDDENALSSTELGLQHLSNQSGLLSIPEVNPSLCLSASNTPNSLPAPSSSPDAELDGLEDSEIFSDIVLNYIERMLMEENIDEKFDIYPEEPALLAAEEPFYEILGEKFPPPSQPPLLSGHFIESPVDSITNPYANSSGSTLTKDSWSYDPVEYSQTDQILIDYYLQSSFSSSNNFGYTIDRVDGSLLNTLASPDFITMTQPAWQFERGIEEARKFLPSNNKFVINIEVDGFHLPQQIKGERTPVEVNKEEEEDKENQIHPSRGRKNLHEQDLDLDLEEGRNNKQYAVFCNEHHRRELFDQILLCNGEKCAKSVDELRVKLQNEVSKISHRSHSKGSSGGRGRGKKQSKREVVDIRTLLIHCAQAAAADDHRNANELLKQIRHYSSPHGDANQRLAHWFADGLEARLAGTGSQIYHCLVAKRIAVTDILKAYQLYLAACPFKKISHFFSTQTILDVAERATKLHIVDFGLYYGFQWPCFMQRLSSRPGGPPKLRISGIDLPMPGFRPTELIDETGQRLAEYARSFNIPFEFHAIATKWETIRVEDLNIDKDEVVVVNCLYRLKNLMDETVVVDSPRDKVLNTIRNIKPNVFIHGILNGTYSAPFFVTRFREALFHFSSLFDMIETNVPHEDESRQLIEKVMFGREAINVISCEGTERVERPGTYKQWLMRNLRAGFSQLPLKPEILKKAKDRVKSCYHKDFVVDEDSQWLLLGWKGRIIYALSTWKSNCSS